MAENSGAEKSLSPLREILRNKRVRSIGRVLVLALAGIALGLALASLSPDRQGTLVLVGLAVTAIFLLILAILTVLWKVPQWQVGNVEGLDAKERFDCINEARKTLATMLGGMATILGGIVLLAGAFFTWRNFNLAQETLTVSQQGQITDRLLSS